MNADHDLAALAGLCGILPAFHDLQGHERITSPETQKALLAANAIDVGNDAAIRASLAAMRHAIEARWFPEEIIVESGESTRLNFGLGATWQLHADGQQGNIAAGLPNDVITLPPLSSGVYVLTAEASGRLETVTVLAAPARLPSIQNRTGRDRLWGMNLALYGLRSNRSTGLGDFEDLARAAEGAGAQGGAFLGINPIHNNGFSDRTSISPYSPSHRGFLETTYIALDAIPGVPGGVANDAFAGISEADQVQYGKHKQVHNASLEKAYATFTTSATPDVRSVFAEFKVQSGPELQDFARYEALGEIHGADWRSWPAALGQARPERIEFHVWLQWVANTQLASAQTRAKAAGMPLGLYLDLAVGPRRDGAESWCDRDTIATGVSIGAPPDHLSPGGQNWNLAAFAPRKLSTARYAPLRRILAQTMRHAGIIRIDHVLGLNRSFWIPDDGCPGAYIRQPFDGLLAVIKIEAERHGCVVIGEDLGLVPQGFRDTMRDHGFYGYSVLQYERDRWGRESGPREPPSQVLSCFATHDTPTIRGFEVGRDIDWWHKLGWIEPADAEANHRQRAADVTAFHEGGDFAHSVHTKLATSNAELVAVQLDDILQAVEAQNLPGTIDQHPNWRRRYDILLEDICDNPGLAAVTNIMRNANRAASENCEKGGFP